MSKLIEKYNELKEKDKDKLYLFKSGKFYIFLCDDADYINEYVKRRKFKQTVKRTIKAPRNNFKRKRT